MDQELFVTFHAMSLVTVVNDLTELFGCQLMQITTSLLSVQQREAGLLSKGVVSLWLVG